MSHCVGGEMSMEDDLDRRKAMNLWRSARPAKMERRPARMTSILSVRLPREVLRDLTLAARRQGKGPGTFSRELIEEGLVLHASPSPALISRVLTRFLESTAELEQPRQWILEVQPSIRQPIVQTSGEVMTSAAP